MSDSKLTKYTTDFIYGNKSTPIVLWTIGNLADVHTILYLGTIQIGRLPKIIAADCPSDVVVVQGAPHWLARPNGDDIPDFMYSFTECIYNFIKTYTCPHATLDIIAESQAVPGILRLAAERTHEIEKIILIQPLGLNSQFFGATPAKRFKELSARTRSNFQYQIPALASDPGLLFNHLIMSAVSLRESVMRRAKNHYAAGLAHSSVKDLVIVKDKVSIILGENDQLFPYDEIAKNLKDSNIHNINIVRVADIPHSPLSSKAGKILLSRALNELTIA